MNKQIRYFPLLIIGYKGYVYALKWDKVQWSRIGNY